MRRAAPRPATRPAARRDADRMARIVTVYNTERHAFDAPSEMAHIRWRRISEALARLGHQVDMASAELGLRVRGRPIEVAPNLRRVPLARVDWEAYDVVKTLYHQGFETLRRHGGDGHRFIIARLASVVGPADMPGIYFFGARRARMFEVQRAIHARARHVAMNAESARDLWTEAIGAHPGFLIVPGAADAELPPPGPDPYPPRDGFRCVFSGNLYGRVQPEAERALVAKLNTLGERIAPEGRLFVFGTGDRGRLDRRWVTHLGAVPHASSWDHMRHADVGVVVSAGAFMHNNESTKVYHYLRVGLPTVSESGFPNDHVVRESGIGTVVPSGDADALASAVRAAAAREWDREAATRYILASHTWDRRAAVYDAVIARGLLARGSHARGSHA